MIASLIKGSSALPMRTEHSGQLSSKGICKMSEASSGWDRPCSSAEAESTITASVASFFPSVLGQDASTEGGSSFLLSNLRLT